MKSETQLIHKNMTIGDVVQKYPQLVETLQEFGVHCVGCSVAYWETIEQGFRGHGMSDKDIDTAVAKLNQVASELPKHEEHSGPVDGELELTEKAANKISELLKAQNKESWGLRIKVVPGGCSGYQYGMSLEEKPNEDDTVVEQRDVKVFVDKESLQKLGGSRVDYIDSLQGAGFKIDNPNAHSTCGCGKSFG